MYQTSKLKSLQEALYYCMYVFMASFLRLPPLNPSFVLGGTHKEASRLMLNYFKHGKECLKVGGYRTLHLCSPFPSSDCCLSCERGIRCD